MTLASLHQGLWFSSLLLLLALTMRRGAAPERWTAVAYLAAAVASFVLTAGHRWVWQPYAVSLVDLALLGWLLFIGLRSTRWWPLAAAGLHLDVLLMELGYMTVRRILPLALWSTTFIFAYAVVATLAVGTWLEGGRGNGLRGQTAV